MKSIVLVFGILVSVNGIASQEIYDALDLEPQLIPSPRIEVKYLKSVGGLHCIKTEHIAHGDSYDCTIDQVESFDSQAVYHSLSVEEVSVDSPPLYKRLKKVAGNLTCYKTSGIDPTGIVNHFTCRAKL